MLRYYRRPLSEDDRKGLAEELSFLTGRRRGFQRFVVAATILILLVGIPLAIAQSRDDPNLLYLAIFVLAVYIGILLWAYRENIGDTRWRKASLQGALSKNEARVLHCVASEFLAVPELEDEGPGYFLQVEDGLILCLEGQAYYPTSRFPCADFELVEVLDSEGVPVLFRIDCHGPGLKPARTMAPETKLMMADRDVFPEDLMLLDGTIGDVEERLLDGSAVMKRLNETA